MTAYSFENPWAGIVALREPSSSVPVPLHKLAQQLRQQREDSLEIGGKVLTIERVLALLDRVRYRLVVKQQWVRLEHCDDARYLLRRDRSVQFSAWLESAVLLEERQLAERVAALRSDAHSRLPGASRDGGDPSTVGPTRTQLALSASAPPSTGMPELGNGAEVLLGELGGSFDDEVQVTWVRWASAHASWLHERWADTSPVSVHALRLLADLGAAWVQVALIDRVRRERGTLDGPAAVAEVERAYEGQVWAVLGDRVQSLGLPLLGRGERNMNNSTAPQTVARQIVGALCLADGSAVAAFQAVEAIQTSPQEEVDWVSLLYQMANNQPDLDVQQSGPEHARVFTVTVRGPGGSTATGTATSLKAARREAARAFITRHAPRALSRQAKPTPRLARAARPSPIASVAAHRHTVRHLLSVFDLNDRSAPWMSQALLHGSWLHENRNEASAMGQTTYRVLAAEGARVVNAFSAHRHAAKVLSATTQPTAEAARFHSAPADTYADFFHNLQMHEGLLLGHGSRLTEQICTDTTQAVIATAWREKRQALLRMQPKLLADWLQDLVPDLDPSSVLDRYCAALDLTVEQDTASRGPEHDRFYSTTWILGGSETWSGPWQRSKTKAKVAAADEIVTTLLSAVSTDEDILNDREERLAVQLLEREAQAPGQLHDRSGWDHSYRRFVADRLLNGDLAGHTSWAEKMNSHIEQHHDTPNALAHSFSEQLERHLRRELERATVKALTPWAQEPKTGANIRSRVLYAAAMLAEEMRRPQPDEGRRLTTGGSAVLTTVENLVTELSTNLSVPAELHTEVGESETTLTARIAGVDLTTALSKVLDLLCQLAPGVTWTRIESGVALNSPRLPETTDYLARSGLDALESASASAGDHLDACISRLLAPTGPTDVTDDAARAPQAEDFTI